MNVHELMSDLNRLKTVKPSVHKCEMLVELLVEVRNLDQDANYMVATMNLIADEIQKTVVSLSDADVGQ